MLAASVWPLLIFGTSDLAQDGSPQLSIDLLNRGVGPARVRWAEVLYDGKPVPGPSALLVACCGARDTTPGASIVSSAIQRRVIGADEWIQAMRVTPASTSPAVYEALARSLPGVGMRLCYCSVRRVLAAGQQTRRARAGARLQGGTGGVVGKWRLKAIRQRRT